MVSLVSNAENLNYQAEPSNKLKEGELLQHRISSYSCQDQKDGQLDVLLICAVALSIILILGALALIPPLAIGLVPALYGLVTLFGVGIGGTTLAFTYSKCQFNYYGYKSYKNYTTALTECETKIKANDTSTIRVDDFVRHVNETTKEKGTCRGERIDFATNCKTLQEIEVVLLGDCHENDRVRRCNTVAIDILSKPQATVLVEGGKGMEDCMLQSEKLKRHNFTYKSWDKSPKVVIKEGKMLIAKEDSTDAFDPVIDMIIEGRKLGIFIDRFIKIMEKQSSEKLEGLIEEFFKFKEEHTNRKCTKERTCTGLYQELTEFYNRLSNNEYEYMLTTSDFRQQHLVGTLKEEVLGDPKKRVFLVAGNNHVLKEKGYSNFIEEKLEKYLKENNKKYLILKAGRGEITTCLQNIGGRIVHTQPNTFKDLDDTATNIAVGSLLKKRLLKLENAFILANIPTD